MWNEPLDLSEFEARDEIVRPDRDPAYVQDNGRPGRTVSMQKRKQDEGPSKRAQERPAERQIRQVVRPNQAALDDYNKRRERASERASAVTQPARPDHLQTDKASVTRKEPAREHCKQRPTKTKGNGGSRSYVPWCDRRR